MTETGEERERRLQRGRKYDRGTRKHDPDYLKKQSEKQKRYRDREREKKKCDDDGCVIL